MGRELKDLYLFIYDENRSYYRAKQQTDGSYSITHNAQPYPIKYNPNNLLNSGIEFATNTKYFSLTRSITYPLEFIKDGAAILREFYYNHKGIESKLYLTIVGWNGVQLSTDKKYSYDLVYNGKFDFTQKQDDPKSGKFTVSTVDDSAWGVLSQNDDTQFSFDCSSTNPKAVKVLLDPPTLVNRYNFQTVNAPITHNSAENTYTIPLVLVNEDGDSSGLLVKSQTLERYSNWFTDHQTTSKSFFLTTFYAIKKVNIAGTYTFEWSTDTLPSGGLIIYFVTSLNQRHEIFNSQNLIQGKIYSVDFNFDTDLAVGENYFFLGILNDNASRNFTITPIVTNIFVSTKTRPEPQVVYGVRALDLMQDIVRQATLGRYTINSNYLATNNKSVFLSGDSIRGIPNAKGYISFAEIFKTLNLIPNQKNIPTGGLSLKNFGDSLWIEPSNEVYANGSTIINIGDAIDIQFEPATEYYGNEIEVGSPKQDFRHPSGRLEVNSTNSFSMNILSVKKKLDLVTSARTGCYDITFLLLDYKGSSTEDNSGDKSMYLLDITDEQGTAVEDIETFENINIDGAPLEPIIKYPLANDVITNTNPTIRGIAPSGSNINIYIDTILDGNTTADANGNWIYQVNTALTSFDNGVHSGVHIIESSYTDLSAPKSSVSITINTTITTPVDIIYPLVNDNLYNNKPLIYGVAPSGTNVNIFIDNILLGTTTTDNSGRWFFKSSVISNGNHILSINNLTSVNFHVDTNVAHPLITYIGGELDGKVIINTLPLIEGVAQPNTTVQLWLNYISYQSIGTVTSDANGNWSFQVVPINYYDPLTSVPVILAPIRNGLSIISTSLVNYTVGINVSGYKLNRPNYSSLTGVTDNTIFNTNFSPKRILNNYSPRLSPILNQQSQEKIYFQKEDKNANMVTVLNGITVSERDDVPVSSLAKPLMKLEYGVIKTKALKSFAKTLYDFNSGGLIKTNFRGNILYFLPIGSMKMSNINNTIQEWKLLLSTVNSYTTLLNLYKNGITINIMQNAIYHSDNNSLHFVQYNYTNPVQYNYKTIYQDWFNNRNDAWYTNPTYTQKFQTSEIIKDQIVANGISAITLRIYRCFDTTIVDTIQYVPVSPQPIPVPEIVLEATIDLSQYPSDVYFFVMLVGGVEILISERIQTKAKWEKTLFIEASHSLDKPGFFYSTGIKTKIRVEGIIKKPQPVLTTITAKDENGNNETIYGLVTRENEIRFGTAYGLPDYLYLKIAEAITLDKCAIENILWSIEDGESIHPSDDIEGHPLYYYTVKMVQQTLPTGATVAAGDNAQLDSVILVVDGTAVGLPTGSLVHINLDNE